MNHHAFRTAGGATVYVKPDHIVAIYAMLQLAPVPYVPTIKVLRELTGLGLKEAKDIVDHVRAHGRTEGEYNRVTLGEPTRPVMAYMGELPKPQPELVQMQATLPDRAEPENTGTCTLETLLRRKPEQDKAEAEHQRLLAEQRVHEHYRPRVRRVYGHGANDAFDELPTAADLADERDD